MQIVLTLFLFFFHSCSNVKSQEIVASFASDSISSGAIKATATKSVQQNEVCFEITLEVAAGSREYIQPINWTMAWVNQKNQHRLLSLNRRDPASGPLGGNYIRKSGERLPWVDTFKTCSFKPENDKIKGIVLTPKEMPFPLERNLKLNWDL